MPGEHGYIDSISAHLFEFLAIFQHYLISRSMELLHLDIHLNDKNR
jgi:hypothetical protein